jgi:putative cell wall-binding protein
MRVRAGARAVAAGLVAASGMAVAAAQPSSASSASSAASAASAAQAAPATGTTVQVTNAGTVPGSTSQHQATGRIVASCPAGSFAVGGGVDTGPGNSGVFMSSDGPTAGGQGLDAFKTAPMPTPDGWQGIVFNGTTSPQSFTVTAVCEPTTGGSIAPVVVATTAESSPDGETDVVTAACPGTDVALSGGVDSDGQAAFEDFISESGPTTNATQTTGWAAQLDIFGPPSLGYVVGALCAGPSQGMPGSAAAGVPSALSSSQSVGAGRVTITTPACPTGSEAVGAGVLNSSNSEAFAVEALTPLQGGGALPSTMPPGTYPAATQWAVKVSSLANSVTVTLSVVCVTAPGTGGGSGGGAGGGGGGGSRTVTRLAGPSRDATAVAVSQNAFPTAGSAKAVVLSRDDSFADALAGTPLAVHADGPLLLTPPGALDPGTQQEIQRVLPAGGTVFLLGGTSAISQGVADTLTGLGFVATRIAGQDRFDTAVRIAEQLGNPTTVIEATGVNFPDALAAGAAAGAHGDALLLTIDSTQAPETAAYLAAHPADKRIAVGGQAAAADPAATPIAGVDRYDTAAKVATTMFSPTPTTFGAALGTNFPDALSGGARSGLAGEPLLLVTTSAPLPAETAAYLSAAKPSSGVLYGGTSAVDDTTLAALENA